jgi:transcriptional regulator with XRE-family HTH domain
LRKLSEMAGISNPYLSQIERGLRKPSAEILQQNARAL